MEALTYSERDYKELCKDIIGKVKYLDSKFKHLFEENKDFSAEPIETKVKKCFFASFFINYSILLSNGEL